MEMKLTKRGYRVWPEMLRRLGEEALEKQQAQKTVQETASEDEEYPQSSPAEHCDADACFRSDPERRKVEV